MQIMLQDFRKNLKRGAEKGSEQVKKTKTGMDRIIECAEKIGKHNWFTSQKTEVLVK